MTTYTVKLRHREPVADRTTAFYFEKPAGFHFEPGQTLELTLINPPVTDGEGNTRTFSIASAPSEPDLIVATRIRPTAFKRVLSSMPLGNPVQATGPMGSFTLHKDVTKAAVLFARGIGITPFRSMILEASLGCATREIWLFYSNDRPEEAAFLEELLTLAGKTPSFHFVPTMTRADESTRAWAGETHRIGPDMLNRCLGGLHGALYYVAGTRAMVTMFHQRLIAEGVDVDDIRTEEFAGY